MKQLQIFATCLCIIGCKPDAIQNTKLEVFAQTFIEANNSRSTQAMLDLYALEGSKEYTINLLRNALVYESGMPVKSIEFEPLSGSPEEKIHYEHQGIKYGPTLEPRLRMRVRYSTDDRFESLFTIGQNADSEWRIISSRPIE